MATIEITATKLYEELKAASFQGLADAAAPTPMTVTDGTRAWYIPQGICGNAVVMLKSARTKIAQDLKKLGLAEPWYGKSGLSLKTYSFMGFASGGQSLAYNEAICEEIVKVLESYGIEAYVHSWVD